MGTSVKQADWNKWAYMIDSHLWELVALSMDIEPETALEFDSTFGSPKTYKSPPEFVQRLEIAQNHLSNGHIDTTSLSVGNPVFHTVKLTVFSTWAIGIGWELPDKFPKAPSCISNSDIELPNYLPPYLAFMIRAVTELELTKDNNLLKKQITGWLEDNWPSELGKPSQNILEFMGTALRSIEAQKGGPPKDKTSKG